MYKVTVDTKLEKPNHQVGSTTGDRKVNVFRKSTLRTQWRSWLQAPLSSLFIVISHCDPLTLILTLWRPPTITLFLLLPTNIHSNGFCTLVTGPWCLSCAKKWRHGLYHQRRGWKLIKHLKNEALDPVEDWLTKWWPQNHWGKENSLCPHDAQFPGLMKALKELEANPTFFLGHIYKAWYPQISAQVPVRNPAWPLRSLCSYPQLCAPNSGWLFAEGSLAPNSRSSWLSSWRTEIKRHVSPHGL